MICLRLFTTVRAGPGLESSPLPLSRATYPHSFTVTVVGGCGQNPGRAMSVREERKRQAQSPAWLATVRGPLGSSRGPAPSAVGGGGKAEKAGGPEGTGEQD